MESTPTAHNLMCSQAVICLPYKIMLNECYIRAVYQDDCAAVWLPWTITYYLT